MKKTLSFFILVFGTLFPLISQSQDWTWDWAKSLTAQTKNLYQTTVTGTDKQNNIYYQVPYNDSIFFPDTAFLHPGNIFSQNVAIAVYNELGEFLKAVDFYALPDRFIWSPASVTDGNGNIYVAGEFQDRVFIRDSIIYHGAGFDPNIPDVFIVKLNPGFQVLWTRLIWGSSQTFCHGLAISDDNNLFIATEHYGNGAETMHAYYMNQDSAAFLTTLHSFMKIDPEGNLVWRKEVRSTQPGISGSPVFLGADSNVYFRGSTSTPIIVEGDTIPVPNYPAYAGFPYMIKASQDGTILESSIFNWLMWINDMKINQAGDLFFSGSFYDTLYLGQDTLMAPGDSIGYVIGRTDPDLMPQWYEVVKCSPYQDFMGFYLALSDDSLYFTTTCSGQFTLANIPFSIGYYSEALTGYFSPGGALMKTFLTDCNQDLNAYSIALDNCKNILLSGSFKTKANFGPDTLHSYFYYLDGFISKIRRYAPSTFDLGPDTTVCDGITLHGPPGYAYYVWNGETSADSTLQVEFSGKYILEVADENYCWMKDSVQVIVQTMPPIHLGNDTTIFRKDSLELSAEPGFEHYLWSTGDTTNSVTLLGSALGLGSHIISVVVTDGPCSENDSVLVTVINNPGLEEPGLMKLVVHPNPSSGIFYLDIPWNECTVEVSDPKGVMIWNHRLNGRETGPLRIDLSQQPAGIYFIKVTIPGGIMTVKVVKL